MIRSILILVVLAGGLAALYFSGSGKNAPPPTAISASVLGGHTLGQAHKIEILRGDAPPIVLERIEGQYWLVEPVHDLARQARIAQLAKSFDTALMEEAFPERTGAPDAPLLETTGLAEPRARLRLHIPPAEGGAGEGELIEVAIGAVGPLNADIFVMRDGEIYRAGRDLASSLEVNVSEMRERLVFLNSQASAGTVEIRQRTGIGDEVQTIRLERGQGGTWRMVQPMQARTDSGTASRFLDQVLALRIEDFLPGAPKLPDEPPTFEITVEGMGRYGPLRDHVRLWQRPLEEVVLCVADGRPEGFTAQGRSYRGLFERAVEGLRARYLLPYSVEDVVQLRLVPAEGTLMALRRDPKSGFRIVEPYAMAARPTPLAELLSQLRGLHAASFVDDADPDDPVYGLVGGLKVQFQGGRAGEMVELILGADDGGEWTFCRRQDERQVVRIPKGVADALRRPWIEYAGRGVLALEHATIQGLRLAWDDGSGRVERTWRRVGGRWLDLAQEPLEGEDRDRFRLFLEQFDELEAGEVLLEEAAPDGLAVTLSLLRENGEPLRELALALPDPKAPSGPAMLELSRFGGIRFAMKKDFRDTVRWLMQRSD